MTAIWPTPHMPMTIRAHRAQEGANGTSDGSGDLSVSQPGACSFAMSRGATRCSTASASGTRANTSSTRAHVIRNCRSLALGRRNFGTAGQTVSASVSGAASRMSASRLTNQAPAEAASRSKNTPDHPSTTRMTWASTMFSRPNSGLKIHSHRMATTTVGTRCGM